MSEADKRLNKKSCRKIEGETMPDLVSGQLPPEENCPRLGLGFGSRSELVLGLGATRQLAPRKIALQLELGLGLGLVLGLGAIFLGGYCPRTARC